MRPIRDEPVTLEQCFRYDCQIRKNVDDRIVMYNVSADPMGFSHRCNDGVHTPRQTLPAQLLEQQRCAKRLTPERGSVPGQPTC